jgi:hypothetical protein
MLSHSAPPQRSLIILLDLYIFKHLVLFYFFPWGGGGAKVLYAP